MNTIRLDDLAREHLGLAASAPAGRSAHTLFPDHTHRLRQTVIALTAGRRLGEHDSPPEATLQVLRGSVRLHAGDETWAGEAGDLVRIPDARHDLEAVTDAVVLLTVIVAGV
ncbi:cupin domain-containing protein [Kineosporia succinea]|uniref:Quercetin dioxygenase-like cupin family protein n=1 Tax=Kineosporia succinea TaxID=84632 RepID=A0ABT9PEH0_9ACTN|nr:cupin domain-containing protein [Kineosporia succinea]MDP9830867.1 quercetin dioxygenase-like cupin family protein [Kineosporia succinea]